MVSVAAKSWLLCDQGWPGLGRNEGGVGFQVEPGLAVPGYPVLCEIIGAQTSFYPSAPHNGCSCSSPVSSSPQQSLHPPPPPRCLPCPGSPTKQDSSTLPPALSHSASPITSLPWCSRSLPGGWRELPETLRRSLSPAAHSPAGPVAARG